MILRLPIDCLNDILENLEKDKTSLRSCLLVNRLWCTVTVRILWRNVWEFIRGRYDQRTSSSILGTFIACLPNESKNLLSINKISIPTPTPKSPLFNYVSFIQTLYLYQ